MNTRERKREREWKPPLPFETAAGSGCGATLPVIARSTRPQLKHIIMVHHQKNIKDEASIASSLILDRCHLCHFCISESIAFGFDFNWGARSGPAALLFPFHLLRFSMYPLIITLTHTHTHTYIYIYIIYMNTFSLFAFWRKEILTKSTNKQKDAGTIDGPKTCYWPCDELLFSVVLSLIVSFFIYVFHLISQRRKKCSLFIDHFTAHLPLLVSFLIGAHFLVSLETREKWRGETGTKNPGGRRMVAVDKSRSHAGEVLLQVFKNA